MLKDGGNREDIMAYLADRGIPGDEIVLGQLADEVIEGAYSRDI
jgi:hypothetical protein